MADRENVQMAGDYEVMQSFRMGGATMLIGYNPGDATYMTCYQDYDLLGNERFSEAIGSERAMLRSWTCSYSAYKSRQRR